MRNYLLLVIFLFVALPIFAQKIEMNATASLEQVYGEEIGSETLLPMNDLDVEFGYILYQSEITIETKDALLEVENVRDYAVIYADDALQGTLTDNRKKLDLKVDPGTYTLRLYVENIGRITYGPEILDNSKGLFGEITLDGESIGEWQITVLNIRDCEVNELDFTSSASSNLPAFYKGSFDLNVPHDTYLNITGWGMGEVWINGQYIGSYWEEEKQQSIQIPASVLKKGKNEVVAFELKTGKQTTMQLSADPVFR